LEFSHSWEGLRNAARGCGRAIASANEKHAAGMPPWKALPVGAENF